MKQAAGLANVADRDDVESVVSRAVAKVRNSCERANQDQGCEHQLVPSLIDGRILRDLRTLRWAMAVTRPSSKNRTSFALRSSHGVAGIRRTSTRPRVNGQLRGWFEAALWPFLAKCARTASMSQAQASVSRAPAVFSMAASR